MLQCACVTPESVVTELVVGIRGLGMRNRGRRLLASWRRVAACYEVRVMQSKYGNQDAVQAPMRVRNSPVVHVNFNTCFV